MVLVCMYKMLQMMLKRLKIISSLTIFKSGVQIWSSATNPGAPYNYVQNVDFDNNVVLNSGSPLNNLRECFIVASNSQVAGK